MITTRSTISRILSVGAALTLVAAAAAPASAALDPDVKVKSSAEQQAEKELTRTALNTVYCKAVGAEGKRECKTRRAWIREGHDPMGKY